MGENVNYNRSEASEENLAGGKLAFIPQQFFETLLAAEISKDEKTRLFAQMARINVLYMISRAGSGHIGSSFSSMDIIALLHLEFLGPDDIYFSSKGHDAPAFYSVMAGLNRIAFEKIHALRKLNGLPGHPDIATSIVVTNTGSLGMGISKAKGFLHAARLHGTQQRVFVLTGDGELQEGQFWESLVSAANNANGNLTVIVDHNKIQSDTYVSNVSDLGDLEKKFLAFGWSVRSCNGHNLDELRTALQPQEASAQPRIIIAHTVKGRGVSFMEHTAMLPDEEYYKYHSGAPSREQYAAALAELFPPLNNAYEKLMGTKILPENAEFNPITISASAQRMIPEYGKALLHAAEKNREIVALDADLILDTGLIPFREKFPERFIECGIAEQDMVSQAGTMAISGLIPFVHSFACFLTARASEQIYNNCSEQKKIMYVGSLAGIVPGGPGHSHQAVRDVAAMSGMPGITIIEPGTQAQVRQAVTWFLEENTGSCYLRLTSIPYEPVADSQEPFRLGCPQVVREGSDLWLITSGPIMLQNASAAALALQDVGTNIGILNMPWLNSFDLSSFRKALSDERRPLLILENHLIDCGFGNFLIAKLAEHNLLGKRKIHRIAPSGIPVCGTNLEVLAHYGMDAAGISRKVREVLQSRN